MAGRPSTGSTTGIVVGMAIALAVAVLALVVLVVLWTDQESLESEHKSATEMATRLMAPQERTGALSAWYDGASSGKSAARLMSTELQEFAALVDGTETGVQPKQVAGLREGRLTALWERIEDEGLLADPDTVVEKPLLEVAETLYALYAAEHQAKTDANAKVADLSGQIEQLAQSNRQMQQQFDDLAGQLQQQVTTIETDRDNFRSAKTDELGDIQDNINLRNEAWLTERQSLQDELDAERQRLDKAAEAERLLRERIREFQIKPLPGGKARKSDGSVMLAQPGSDIIFVDLGRRDNLTLGLRFAVYPPDRFIPRDGKAKAAIEVVSVGDQVSECRIVWASDVNPVIKGDLIANPVYDRDRRLSFVVMGEYDLNHDGVDDQYGKQTIEAVIMDAGGTIAPELTARVDFMIVGAAPRVRQPSRNPTDEELAITDDDTRRLAAYLQVLQDAQSLSVPMLTQETFLDFLGRR